MKAILAGIAGVLTLGLHVKSEKIHANTLDFTRHSAMVEAHYSDEDFFTEKSNIILLEEDASYIEAANKEKNQNRISHTDTTIDQNGSFRDQQLKVMRNIDVPNNWHEPHYVEDRPVLAFRKGNPFDYARFRAVSEGQAPPAAGKGAEAPGLPNSDSAVRHSYTPSNTANVGLGYIQGTYPSTLQAASILQPATVAPQSSLAVLGSGTKEHDPVYALGAGILRENTDFSRDPSMPYWSVDREPMYPRLQSPFFTSTPVEFYSDGRRYPEDMEEYDFHPSTGKAEGKAAR